MGTGFGVALVRELLPLRELGEQQLERLRRFGVRRELARELGAGVLTPREVPERPDLQLDGRIRPLGLQSRRLAVAAALASRQVLDLLVHRRLFDLVGRRDRRGALDARLLTDLGLDLARELRVFLEEVARVVLALPEPIGVVDVPGA